MRRVITAFAVRAANPMKGHGGPLTRMWILPASVILLIAAHALVLRYASSHAAVSAAVLSGVIVLAVIKHLGLLGSLYAVFRRRTRR